jgi:hypothetical protein
VLIKLLIDDNFPHAHRNIHAVVLINFSTQVFAFQQPIDAAARIGTAI